MMLLKCCNGYVSKFGEFSSDHRTGNDLFLFQSQRRTMPKNFQTTAHLHSPHSPAKQCSKFSKPGFNSAWTENFQMFKLDLEKAEESEIKLPTSVESQKKQEFHRNIYFCFIDYAKVFDCVDHNKLWKILKEMEIPDQLICLLRNLYACQEATIRTGHGTTDWFQIRKGVHQCPIMLSCLFNFFAEYIMRNARLDEAQARIKIAGKNIKNLKYADDTTLMAESKVELKSLLMEVKEERGKVGLKLNIQKTNIIWQPVPSLHGK